jgi:catechol 2,3-dioxygenase-like lactoylglutathione lyase family enzyme
MADFPRLLQTVIDTPDLRRTAEFYRELLGYSYRPGDETPQDGEDWLVLRPAEGGHQLAFQLVDRLEPTTWPEPDVPMQLHLDFGVPDAEELERQRARALALGASVRLDRSDDPDEPLYVFTDPAGHPFCIFVA